MNIDLCKPCQCKEIPQQGWLTSGPQEAPKTQSTAQLEEIQYCNARPHDGSILGPTICQTDSPNLIQ